ncbi:LIV-I protein F [Oligella ureolytica]|uniref:ABC transporter ATP-binding protein n=1 Tax=Oligella ureolytica TaxID=90244 RepID=A0A378XEN1_9BURK|nr:ABC transporter ATP-binding protein [Oligella ureolytica]QPT39021.1 ABC transporter ATP-binding protein [Oligella ureolytica]SUA54516.1 LIV-I protein F [Oligella ureolytica]SUA54575.1 LIV-I protein F [Oligella ureolytica]
MSDLDDSTTLLTVNHLSAWYGRAKALFDLSFEVKKGEVVALMGVNGAGKSTTLKAIMNMMDRKEGQVIFNGQDISKAPSYQIARAGLGFVPEDRRVFSELTVKENLLTGRQPERYWPDGEAVFYWTEERLYQLFPNLGKMVHRPGGKMSGGEQQMLSVARSLMGNPYMVLLDEPSEGVAPVIVDQMIEMIIELKKKGISILISEQNYHLAKQVADRYYTLSMGEIVEEGVL